MTGLAPRDLLDDEGLYAAAVEQAEETLFMHRVAVANLEVTHALWRAVIGMFAEHKSDVPDPLDLESLRGSGDDAASARSGIQVMSASDLARELLGRGGGGG